jgi:hypothetical protein
MVRTIFETDYDGDGLFDKIGSVDGTEIDARAEPAPKMVTSIDDITVSNGKLGMYYLGGCSTGTLGVFEPWGYEPLTLSELFLRNAAIGCIAGDNVVWGEDEWVEREHGGWFSEGLTTRFWEQLFIDNRPGKALALAKMDLVEDRKDASYYEENPYVRWEEKILKQFNLLGDPEVSIWMDRPEHLNFTLSQTDESSLIEVTLNGTQIENATVTLSYDNELHWMGYTNSSGQVEIPVSQEIMNQNHLSVSKRGEIPIQQMTDYIPPKDKIPIDFSLICSSFIIGVVLLAISVRPKKKTKAFTENLNYRTPR